MFLPQRTALTILLKLSSSKIMAAAYLATYVPEIPIAKPTSAFFSAGASFVPSPVTATTCPLSFNPVTKAYLSSGLDRDKTAKCGTILSNISPLAIVSILYGLFLSLAVFESRGQSHYSVLQFLQTTPPTLFINYTPSRIISFD